MYRQRSRRHGRLRHLPHDQALQVGKAIAGGGKIGLHLIRALLAQNHEVALIERDRRVCEAVYREYEEVAVIAGDGTNPELLVRAGIEKADVMVAVAGRDQDNYMICKMAKDLFGVKRTLARVNELASHLITPSIRYSKPELQTHITYLYSMTTMADQKIGHDAVERYQALRKELDQRKAEADRILGKQ